MSGESFRQFLRPDLPTPIHILDEVALRGNLEILSQVQQASGARIILALKAFAQWSAFPIIREYLPGATASSLNEAMLAHEHFGGELHVTAPAYPQDEFSELLKIADHIVFNSFRQWHRFRAEALAFGNASGRQIEFGLRLNPEHRETEVELYDPCAPGSRLGATRQEFDDQSLEGISGLHFHTLCQRGLPALARTLAVVERNFGEALRHVRWVNFGGGHHITQPGYDVPGLIDLIRKFRARYGVEVYLEPGEAAAINTGVLVSRVLDVRSGQPATVIVDASATAHMPDTLEMPYRAEILDASLPGDRAWTARLGGMTCLAGDILGDYSFDRPLQEGDWIVFLDMSHYTMVKSSNFNGVRTPSIAIGNSRSGELRIVRRFGYADYRDRLG